MLRSCSTLSRGRDGHSREICFVGRTDVSNSYLYMFTYQSHRDGTPSNVDPRGVPARNAGYAESCPVHPMGAKDVVTHAGLDRAHYHFMRRF